MNWYIYCKNNPIKFIDPDGLIVLMVNSLIGQQQNNPSWAGSFLGGKATYDNIEGKANTIGSYGCRFTAVVNAVRSKQARDAITKALDHGDMVTVDKMNKEQYFNFSKNKKGGTDVSINEEGMRRMVSDVTGKTPSVYEYTLSEDETWGDVIGNFVDAEGEFSLIAIVPSPSGYPDGHAININRINDDGSLNYYDTYSENSNEYSYIDIQGMYVISYD